MDFDIIYISDMVRFGRMSPIRDSINVFIGWFSQGLLFLKDAK